MSLGGYADIFLRNTMASGVVPQISLVMGPCAGGAVYSPAITDVIIMVEGSSYMFVTGPEVVRAVTHEDVDREQLGGASVHTEVSGVAHLAAPDEGTAIRLGARGAGASAAEQPLGGAAAASVVIRSIGATPHWMSCCPTSPTCPTTCTRSSRASSTTGTSWSCNPTGRPTSSSASGGSMGGAWASSPSSPPCWPARWTSTPRTRRRGSCACATRSTCPLLTLVDVPGFLPGVGQEHRGIIRHGAKLLYAYAEATVPKVTVIIRKAYGGAYDVMSSRHVRGDVNLAWPMARIAVMGVEGAVNIIFRAELEAATDREAELKRLTEEYESTFANPYVAASRGYVDDVIRPSDTRPRIIGAFAMLAGKRERNPARKHGNIPL